jgi:hypothetical protein
MQVTWNTRLRRAALHPPPGCCYDVVERTSRFPSQQLLGASWIGDKGRRISGSPSRHARRQFTTCHRLDFMNDFSD